MACLFFPIEILADPSLKSFCDNLYSWSVTFIPLIFNAPAFMCLLPSPLDNASPVKTDAWRIPVPSNLLLSIIMVGKPAEFNPFSKVSLAVTSASLAALMILSKRD